MSRFFVGQRVRVNCPTSIRNGAECVIEALGVAAHTPRAGHYTGIQVSLRHSRFGMPLVFEHHEIEPLTPEGMKPVEWSECLWQPEHLRESAHG